MRHCTGEHSMPRTLILHIGTMKTGSTTIQYLLTHNRPALLARGVYYPGTQNGSSHLLLAMCFTSLTGAYADFGNGLWGGKEPVPYLAAYRAQFRQEILDLPPHVDRVIVSCEQFSQLVRETEDIARLRDFMAELFDDIKILIYLRRQDGHFASNYSQTLRNGMVRTPGFQRWKEGGHSYDYARMLDRWAEIFSAPSMAPRIFERDTNKSYDVVEDFIAQTGCGPLPAPKDDGALRNPSMNLAGQRILRDIGRMLKEDGDGKKFARSTLWKRLTSQVTAALPGQGWRPTQTEAREFMAQFAANNEDVRKRWFPERETLFSTSFGHLPVEPDNPTRKLDQEAAYQVILHLLRETIAKEQEVTKRRAGTQRNPDLRRAALMKSVRNDPANPELRLELAALQIDEGAIEPARHNINVVLKRNPGHERAMDMLASLPSTQNAEA
jgi:hypothetical protein